MFEPIGEYYSIRLWYQKITVPKRNSIQKVLTYFEYDIFGTWRVPKTCTCEVLKEYRAYYNTGDTSKGIPFYNSVSGRTSNFILLTRANK